MKFARLAVLALVIAAPTAHAQLRIAYRVAMPVPASHLFEVEMDIDGVRGASLPLQLPVWSTGRYARFDFAKNVQDLKITTAKGRTLAYDKTNGSRWVVRTGGSSSVRLTYRVFANSLSGTFSVLDTAHANWNGAALFMYVENRKQDPVSLTIAPPPGWQVMNGDTRTANQLTYRFENYDRLIDTPTEVAPALMVDSFYVDGRKIRTMVHYNGVPPAGTRQRFVRDVERIVRYQHTVFSAPPLDQFTFLVHIGYAGGDGMEHLYSTQVVNSNPWRDTASVLPGLTTSAHEYFHVWNVKRVRPVALGPFNYADAIYQPSLWVAEGWTQYFGQATMHRAGITPRSEFYASMAGTIRQNLTAPGRKQVSARMASFHAPFWDGAAQGQPTNRDSTFFTYYTKGAGLAMYLDLYIRAKSGNAKALDDVFNTLKRMTWNARNASYYLQGRGYTELDVERAASEVAGENMHAWFEKYVGGTTDLDYDAMLAQLGLRLVREGPWRIEEVANASPAQIRIREGWVTGRRN